jgi:ribulose-phosphate 3-epimerase
MLIIPAVLESTFEGFAGKIKKLSKLFQIVQIDVMDGDFVPSKSFEEIDKINDVENLPDFELHLMVRHPLEELKKWEQVKNIKRVIFHIESADDPLAVAGAISGRCAQTGIAINPETPLDKIMPYLDRINEVLFLAVHPGEQGAKFLPEVGEKIKILAKTPHRPIIGVDGGITEDNIAKIKSWGVEVFCIGSALSKADDLEKTYNNLLKQLY